MQFIDDRLGVECEPEGYDLSMLKKDKTLMSALSSPSLGLKVKRAAMNAILDKPLWPSTGMHIAAVFHTLEAEFSKSDGLMFDFITLCTYCATLNLMFSEYVGKRSVQVDMLANSRKVDCVSYHN